MSYQVRELCLVSIISLLTPSYLLIFFLLISVFQKCSLCNTVRSTHIFLCCLFARYLNFYQQQYIRLPIYSLCRVCKHHFTAIIGWFKTLFTYPCFPQVPVGSTVTNKRKQRGELFKGIFHRSHITLTFSYCEEKRGTAQNSNTSHVLHGWVRMWVNSSNQQNVYSM